MKQIIDQIERELSSENVSLITRYDREMVSQSMATATRQKHLRTLFTLSRLLNKDWNAVKNYGPVVANMASVFIPLV